MTCHPDLMEIGIILKTVNLQGYTCMAAKVELGLVLLVFD